MYKAAGAVDRRVWQGGVEGRVDIRWYFVDRCKLLLLFASNVDIVTIFLLDIQEDVSPH